MLQCEAKLLLRWSLAQRREYLARPAVQPRREALQQEMKRQHATK